MDLIDSGVVINNVGVGSGTPSSDVMTVRVSNSEY